MALPNPSMVFVPFDILTAEELNQMAANDQALSAGTGLTNGSVAAAKIAPEAWQSWTPALVGWSGTPTVSAKYMRVGKTVHVSLSISGTSNNAITTITLPSTSVNDVRVATSNNTATTEYVGLAYVAAGSNSLISRRGQSGTTGEFFSGWAATGAKNIIGLSMTYEEA